MHSKKNSYSYFEKEYRDFNADFSSSSGFKDPIRKLVRLLWRKSGSAARFEQATKLIQFEVNSKTILEIGCGHGHCSLFFAKLGAHVTGVDFSPNMLKLAENNKKKCLHEITGSCLFEQNNIFAYSPGKHFFLVFALGVIDYIEADKVDIFMDNLASLSEKWVLLAFPLKLTLFYFIRRIWLKYFKGCDVIHFTKKEIQQICEKARLDIVKNVYHAGYSLCLMKKI